MPGEEVALGGEVGVEGGELPVVGHPPGAGGAGLLHQLRDAPDHLLALLTVDGTAGGEERALSVERFGAVGMPGRLVAHRIGKAQRLASVPFRQQPFAMGQMIEELPGDDGAARLLGRPVEGQERLARRDPVPVLHEDCPDDAARRVLHGLGMRLHAQLPLRDDGPFQFGGHAPVAAAPDEGEGQEARGEDMPPAPPAGRIVGVDRCLGHAAPPATAGGA